MEELRKYLSDKERTFEAGMALFEKYATAAMKAKYGAYLERSKNQWMLASKLQFLINANIKLPASAKVVVPAGAVSDRQPQKALEQELPDDLKQSYARIKELMPPMASLHEQIGNESITIDQRKALAMELCAMEDEAKECWNRIDDWKESQNLPPDADVLPKGAVTIEDMVNQKNRLMANIARTQRKLAANFYSNETTKHNALKNLKRDEKLLEELEANLRSSTKS